MPAGTSLPFGNTKLQAMINPTLTFTPATVAGTTGSEVTCTVNGVQLGDYVDVSKPTQQNYIGIGNVRVSAANVLAITFTNSSTGTVTPTASEVYTVVITRPDAVVPTSLPSGLV
jgi:hypothetical protein